MLNNAAAVNAEAGPNTAARGTAFNGLSPAERAVQALYLAALGRAGMKAELDLWVPLIGNNTFLPQSVVSAIEGSAEAKDRLVKSWYIAYLGRQANGVEEQGFVTMLQSGESEEQVLAMMLGTQEFLTRAQLLVSSGSQSERFVQALYQLLLGRQAGAKELQDWVNAIPQIGRQGVALALLQSGEFHTNQFEGYYDTLLHRPADAAALGAWVNIGLDVFTVRIAFEGTAEFFSNG
jgi:hypothetical protein